MGRQQQHQGAQLEADLIAQCDWLEARGRARVRRRNPPMIKIGEPVRGVFRARTAKGKAGESADFEGVLLGGRSVSFDAKTCKDDARFNFSKVPDRQWSWLLGEACMGGLAFLYVCRPLEFRRTGPTCILPISPEGLIAGVGHRRSSGMLDGAVERRESIRWDAVPEGLWRRPEETMWLDHLERLLREGRWFGGGLEVVA